MLIELFQRQHAVRFGVAEETFKPFDNAFDRCAARIPKRGLELNSEIGGTGAVNPDCRTNPRPLIVAITNRFQTIPAKQQLCQLTETVQTAP